MPASKKCVCATAKMHLSVCACKSFAIWNSNSLIRARFLGGFMIQEQTISPQLASEWEKINGKNVKISENGIKMGEKGRGKRQVEGDASIIEF